MRFKSIEKQTAYNAAGWRERYAMEHGNATTIYINGDKCIKFTAAVIRIRTQTALYITQ